MSQNFKLPRITQLATSIALALGGVAVAQTTQAAAPAAGSNINNIASATYNDASGNPQSVTSNQVTTTVLQVGSFTLVDNRTASANPNGSVSLSHTLTNTGNGSDTYTLALAQLTTDAFNLNNLQVYLDANNDGVKDSNTPVTSVTLAPGASVGLIIESTVPSTVTTGQAQYTITATSAFDSATDTDTDTVVVTNGAVLRIEKAASVSSVSANGEIEYTLTYRNTGNAAAANVSITDNIDVTKVAYVPNSGRWNGSATPLTDGAFGDPAGINYQVNATTGVMLISLDNVPANSTGTIKFKVQANTTNTANILNTASVFDDNDNDASTTPNGVTPTNSNQTVVTVTRTYSGTVNERTNNDYADAATVPSDVNQDNTVKENATIGTPVVFGNNTGSADQGPDQIVIHNTGTGVETYNVTVNQADLPAGSTVELFKSDGATPLTDTNGDGIVDTGPIAAGSTANIVAKVTLPSNYSTPINSATTDDVILTIDPVNNPSASANDTLKLSIVDVLARDIDFLADQQGQIQPGGTILYTHTLTNNGGFDEGVGSSVLTLTDPSTTHAGTMAGAVTSVYVDLDNDGVADINELVTNFSGTGAGSLQDLLSQTGTAGLQPGESVSILVKVEAPLNATAGQYDLSTITITPTGTLGGLNAPAAVQVVDRTVVNIGQLRLEKFQGLDINCDGDLTDTDEISFTKGTLQAKPGQCIQYRIVATNDGNQQVTNVVMSDPVPAYTTVSTAPAPAFTTGYTPVQAALGNPSVTVSNGSNGSVITSPGFAVDPLKQVVIEFAVKVDAN
ncbi:beta strand repeat-containing protein [Acinetobacter sp.]|uniref:beta strand repeat-containing protein n=1 Tax=Acinetobacter sp. TaxID=472 RepID=UPI0035B07B31